MINKVFINTNFFLLWLGKAISQLGDRFYGIALAWWILQQTNSPKLMGLFLVVSVLPQLLFGFFAGALVDRWNRKAILIITDIIRGLLVMAIVYLSLFHLLQIWHVFVIGAAISLTTAFFEPAVQAVIPQVVSKERLKEANSMSQMISGICSIAGPIFGAAAIGLFGLVNVFLLNSISYFLSAALEFGMHLNTDYKINTKSKYLVQDTKEGLVFLKNNKEILRVIVIIAAAHFFLGSLMVVIPFLSKALSGNGVQNLGSLEAMLGVGMVFGSVYIGKKKHNTLHERSLINLVLFVGICFLAISLGQFFEVKTVVSYMMILGLIGFGIACASVYWQSLIQLNTPGHMTGRVFSVSTLAANVSLPAAYGLFGVLLTHSSIMLLMLFSGCCLIVLRFILIFKVQVQKS